MRSGSFPFRNFPATSRSLTAVSSVVIHIVIISIIYHPIHEHNHPNTDAWKPLLLARLRREFPSSAVVWLDSGLTFGGGHSRTFLEDAAAAAARSGGVVSDHTARTLEDFTHQGMFQYFEETWGLARSFFTTDASEEVLNCNGAFSAWESQDDGERGSGSGRTSGGNGGGKGERSVSQRAMDMWEQCALDARCICPAGSSRANHRQDQAALTLVLAANGKRCYGSAVGSRGPFGNATDWVHAHGLRMKSVLCQDARCFVEKHAPACLLRKKEAEATKRIRQ
jgi:hypothetical protein